MQQKQSEWQWQWQRFYDDNQWLFSEWIKPNTFETFRDKEVLDCGCGGGQHVSFVAPYAKHVLGVDLNATDSAKRNTEKFPNVEIVEGDIAVMDLGKKFDVVYSIGVLHHTDSPDASFANIAKHCKPGGRVIVWVYSREGNFWNRTLLEWIKRVIIFKLPRSVVKAIGWIMTALLYPIIYTVYLLPLKSLPFYEYFQNWRTLSFERNFLNVFDKLNAPQTWFITREQIGKWFSDAEFTDVSIAPYKGVSWSGSGTKR